MKADYVHKDTLTTIDYVELNKNNELLMSYNQELLKENQSLKKVIEKAIEELKRGLHELDTRRREEVYIEQYIEEALDILKEVSE